jgi:hypothetical protein
MFEQLDNEALLSALTTERSAFTRSDPLLLRLMIEELIRRKVYPTDTVEGNPNSVVTMVEGWGARWHEWRPPFECQHCHCDLRDYRTGPPFKREIAVTDFVRDHTVDYRCPDCDVSLLAGATAWKRVLDDSDP